MKKKLCLIMTVVMLATCYCAALAENDPIEELNVTIKSSTVSMLRDLFRAYDEGKGTVKASFVLLVYGYIRELKAEVYTDRVYSNFKYGVSDSEAIMSDSIFAMTDGILDDAYKAYINGEDDAEKFMELMRGLYEIYAKDDD